MMGNNIEGASETKRTFSVQENPVLTWKKTERVEEAINQTRRELEVETSEEREITTGSQQIEVKSLVLLQINTGVFSMRLQNFGIRLTHIIRIS